MGLRRQSYRCRRRASAEPTLQPLGTGDRRIIYRRLGLARYQYSNGVTLIGSGGFVRLPDSKTNEPRTIHLSDAALEVLKAVPRVGPYVIAGVKHGEAFKNLSRAWIVAREYAGLKDVRLHDLRHSYASLAAGRGVSLQMIGKLLGHKVPATTARYAHLARDAVQAVNDELGAVMEAAIKKPKR